MWGRRRWVPADRDAARGARLGARGAGVARGAVRSVRGRPRWCARAAGRPPLDAVASMRGGRGAAPRRFVLLDRDGTINEEVGHLARSDDLRLIPGSAEAIRRLRTAGLGIVVVTNQADVGRGLLAPEDLESIHARLLDMLAAEEAEVDAVLHCPHAPEDGCDCRKPAPGMARAAAERFGFDGTDAFVVGDHAGDVGLGRAIGATTFLVLTGHGAEEAERARHEDLADHVVPDLSTAADIITALVEQEAG
ncbi:MAG: HAD family hydrolase [Actinomycetota bacterium]|nr:HAD family hydrolase [Actinomycetota bacterium]MDH5333285.1 HAD family hydrolase [Thermoleophilia bacterium]